MKYFVFKFFEGHCSYHTTGLMTIKANNRENALALAFKACPQGYKVNMFYCKELGGIL